MNVEFSSRSSKQKNDLAGFEKWVVKTKYTADRIKKEYAKREKLKNIDNP